MNACLPFDRLRRGSAPAGGSLFSAGPEKSNQKRGPEHQPFGDHASATRLLQRLWLENIRRTTASVTSLRFKHAVSTRLDPVGSSVWVLVPQPLSSTCSRSVTAKWAGVQALCFGDFHLGPQMKTGFGGAKVTRQPGRDPAGCTAKRLRLARQQKHGGHA